MNFYGSYGLDRSRAARKKMVMPFSEAVQFADDGRLIRNVCVYCGSAQGIDPIYKTAAEKLGHIMAMAGIGLVYGGGATGLMGVIAKSVLSSGGRVTGIIPDFLAKREIALTGIQECLIVNDMHQRKRLMFDRADGFVALPGGIGTLEELAEQLTWVQLERHTKPVVIADIEGFWQPLLGLFAHMRERGFIRLPYEIRYFVAEKIEDVLPMMESAAFKVKFLGKSKETVDPRF